MTCAAVTRELSDGDRRVVRRRFVRLHLRECGECRAFREAIEWRRAVLPHLFEGMAPDAAAELLAELLGRDSGPGGPTGGELLPIPPRRLRIPRGLGTAARPAAGAAALALMIGALARVAFSPA